MAAEVKIQFKSKWQLNKNTEIIIIQENFGQICLAIIFQHTM